MWLLRIALQKEDVDLFKLMHVELLHNLVITCQNS